VKEAETKKRLPPGQVLRQKWPVLTYGATPRVDLQTWTFRCFGYSDQETDAMQRMRSEAARLLKSR
jgi:hypothetical protein